jgi:tRNA-specific 2-thiouridylase
VAGLLAEAGHEGAKRIASYFYHGRAIGRKGACCAGQDILDARRVAGMLGVPHYVLDCESRFQEAVIDDFAASYLAGETPVPCIRCHQSVKFSDLLRAARELGASALVTGHYVRSRQGPAGWEMLRALCAERDQSYFLFATTQDQLDFLRFPLGSLQKSETRALAAALGLPVSAKPDSQDICFAPGGDYAGVIRRLRPESAEPGEIVHADGTVLGAHPGIVHFTVGQRKGLGVAIGEPLFVIRIEAATRRVVVGPRDMLRTARIKLREVNWIGGGALDEACLRGRDIFIKVRSTQPARPATLVASDGEDGARLALSAPEFGVAAGQACVFYDRDASDARVLGGGFIVS